MTLFRVTLTPTRFLALISSRLLKSSPSSDERTQDGRHHHGEGEDFRQPHWSNRSPSPSSPWMVSLGSFAIRLGGLWGGVQKGGAAYRDASGRASAPGKS